jgi:hypothetical protein
MYTKYFYNVLWRKTDGEYYHQVHFVKNRGTEDKKLITKMMSKRRHHVGGQQCPKDFIHLSPEKRSYPCTNKYGA